MTSGSLKDFSLHSNFSISSEKIIQSSSNICLNKKFLIRNHLRMVNICTHQIHLSFQLSRKSFEANFMKAREIELLLNAACGYVTISVRTQTIPISPMTAYTCFCESETRYTCRVYMWWRPSCPSRYFALLKNIIKQEPVSL